MKWLLLFLVVASLSLVRFDSQSEIKEDYTELPKETLIPVEMKRHLDGDTTEFILNNQTVRVRYLLIDTPETIKKGTKIQPFGKAASERTEALLSGAKKIEIMLDKGNRTDLYGRLCGYVFVDGKLVQSILVSEGLACVSYVKYPSVYYLDELQQLEAKAKESRIGIWGIDGYVKSGRLQRIE